MVVRWTGVEADIWLKEGSLLMWHTEDSLNANRTVRSLYSGLLLQILEDQTYVAQLERHSTVCSTLAVKYHLPS